MFQIQPEYKNGEEYLVIAEKEKLYFEVLELSKFGACGKNVIEWYKRSGAVMSFHGAFIDINPVSNDKKIAAVSRKRCEDSCRLAATLGARNVVFHSSCFPFLRGKYLDGWAEKCAEYYVCLADEYGVEIFVENSFDLDPTPLAELMKRASDSRVRVCLDIGHANLSRTPLEGWIESLGEHIGYVHLSDNDGLFDNHKALGTGTVDIKRASELISPLGNIPMTLEVGGTEDIRKSIEYIKENRLFGT